MTRLLRAEALRLLSRRFTLLVVLAVVLVVGLFQIQVAAAVSPPSAQEVAANRAEFDRYVGDWEANHEQWEAECIEAGERPTDCASYYPRPTEADWGLSAVPFAEAGGIAVQLAVYLSALGLFFVAASFVGAEFTSGAIANWLTFVPRRGAVFVSKLVITVAFAVTVSAATSTLTLGAAGLLTVTFGGHLDGLDALVAQAARGLVVAVILAVVGFCAGLLTRHTAAAIGVLLVYLFAWFTRSVLLSGQAWAQRLTRWSPEGNLAAIVNDGSTYAVPRQVLTPEGVSEEYLERTISFAHGLGYWGIVLAGLVGGTLLVFRRRDVS